MQKIFFEVKYYKNDINGNSQYIINLYQIVDNKIINRDNFLNGLLRKNKQGFVIKNRIIDNLNYLFKNKFKFEQID